MESSEGRGLAKARRERFLAVYEPAERVGLRQAPDFSEHDVDIRDDVRLAFGQELVDSAADLGFWIAWHQAGGFEALERAGWHRTTIFRKLKRFRRRFGQHPDEWKADWLNLDLERFWALEVDFEIDYAEGRVDIDAWSGFSAWSDFLEPRHPGDDGPE